MSSGSSRRRVVLAVAVVLPLLSSGCKGQKDTRSDGLPPGAQPLPAASATVFSGAPESPPAKGSPDVKMGPLGFSPVAKKADPSVVTIYTAGEEETRGGLFGRRATGRSAKGLGSGFIVQSDGVIITNNHVIEGADEILVQLSDERRLPARVAGRDPRTDIAVVKVDGAKDLVAIPLGDSDGLEVGDWVVAIGNPFGLSHTVSAGIVSAKGRGREDVPLDPSGYYNFLQTDASINPGNSGGPLLNLKGEVVGMNTAIRGGGAQGIGFAIPINMVKQLLPTLLEKGHFTRSALGVRIRDIRELTPDDKAQLGIKVERGAVIEYVEASSPAGKAGLKVGDVVVGFEGQPIERGTHLQWLASTAGVGRTVTVRVVRPVNGLSQPFEMQVTLAELKEPQKRPARPKLGFDDEP